jgi:hypothetical protein
MTEIIILINDAQDLARASAVGVATIRRAELAERETSMTTPKAVRRALECAPGINAVTKVS